MTTALELNATLPYATEDELHWLIAHGATLPDNARAVMIGAGPCVMALALLQGNPSIVIRIIDISEMDYCKAHIKAEFPDALIFYYQLKSTEFDIVRELDFLIVDGSHKYTDVLNDARYWLPKLEVNGYALFHDYDATGTDFDQREQYPGVKQALNRYLRGQRDTYERIERVGTSLIVRRKRE